MFGAYRVDGLGLVGFRVLRLGDLRFNVWGLGFTGFTA